jgi:AcrR family transcriptional regulator
MATQGERRAATRGAIIEAASRLFGEQGFSATTVDHIAAAAGIAKGAVYHHFPNKEAVFEAVFEATSEVLARDVRAASRGAGDPLEAMAVGNAFYFAACAQGPLRQIILRDGPAVLGWARWREVDARYFSRMIPLTLAAAMDAGLMARQPVEPLAMLILGAVTEAAMACAASDDPVKTSRETSFALNTILSGLRRPVQAG